MTFANKEASMSISERNSCGFKHCAFCGDSLKNTLVTVVFNAPSESVPKLIPLRWRFLSNKAPLPKYICVACKEKRLVSQKCEQSVGLDIAWDEAHAPSEPSDKAIKLEHLERHDQNRQQRQNKQKQHQEQVVVKLLANQCSSFENVPLQKQAIDGQLKSRLSDQINDRLSSTAEFLETQQLLELPYNNCSVKRASTMTLSGAEKIRHVDIPQAESQQNERSDKERQRQRSVSHAQMLQRMRQHYTTVRVNGTSGYCATAPPRRIRHERRNMSIASCNHEEEPIKTDTTDVAIDLAYLRVYKDAR
ncbi:uncharacterized protein PHALS_10382 [Plasmopara halstedii]|uniref:Uncharacterized protein n=1 Tax=Plasmopara halstedii TaxID=4781 RepID=A0A0P1AI47_PLAHL|nr:uncharacterized protein PHALS_10382 [Plasmopara halstedii]CEG40170.1 hypothetical protein PHALS_10382 [Plasmopara halstedii]|eukprot:XP_024576539.1 hypothetical protein PHALS_10382 [Plasmopara halstedii]